MSRDFSHLPLLDSLRPPAGWRTDCAVLSTYSAHMPVLAAALLALAGEADDAGSGSRVALVRALTGLRGKVHFVIQAGRLSLGRRTTTIAALFDRYLVQVPWDESASAGGKSWHAKFALLRQVPVDPQARGERWVFLLGSRNLTLDTSWDIGFELKSSDGSNDERDTTPQSIEGIARLSGDLARLFPDKLKRWSECAAKLRTIRWQVRDGFAVSDLRLMLPEDPGRALPDPPDELHRLVAVSPFLDRAMLDTLQKWKLQGAGSWQLLSTRSALAGCLDASGAMPTTISLLALAEADLEAPAAPADSDDQALEASGIGLHAKMIYAEHATGTTLWLGSPNLTQRAWTRNAECVLRLEAMNKHAIALLRDGINGLLERADVVDTEELRSLVGEETIEQRLADARNTVAASLASAWQERTADGQVFIESLNAPHSADPDVELQCGRMLAPMTLWLRATQRHAFAVSWQGIDSDFVCLRLSLAGEAVDWMQLVPFQPPLDLEQRDGQALSEYLGSQQMLSWIRSVLAGYTDGDEGGAWDEPKIRQRTKVHAGIALELPSLEQALRMWLKDPERLKEVDRILELANHRRDDRSGNAAEDAAMKQRLLQFAATWKVIRSTLGGGAR